MMTEQNGTRIEQQQQQLNANLNEDDFEDPDTNSAKLFERSRIKALAGNRLDANIVSYVFGATGFLK